MEASLILQIAQIESISADRLICIVRCLQGTLTVGQTVNLAGSTDLRVVAAWRYDKPVDLLDPPHIGKVEVVGEFGVVRQGDQLTA